MEQYQGTKIEEPPTLIGSHARAWMIPLIAPELRSPPDWRATVSGWLINAPGAHVAWSMWMLSVIHLRPIEGVKPAHITLEGATHELMIAAIDPGYAIPSIDAMASGAGMHYLVPIDVAEQFIVRDDVQAERLCELSASAICHGWLSPDQDYRSQWKQAIAETAAHLREEFHGPIRRS